MLPSPNTYQGIIFSFNVIYFMWKDKFKTNTELTKISINFIYMNFIIFLPDFIDLTALIPISLQEISLGNKQNIDLQVKASHPVNSLKALRRNEYPLIFTKRRRFTFMKTVQFAARTPRQGERALSTHWSSNHRIWMTNSLALWVSNRKIRISKGIPSC